MAYSWFTHSPTESPHRSDTVLCLGAPMWLQPKQVPNSLTRQPDIIKKTSQKGPGSRERTDLWWTSLSLSSSTHLSWICSFKTHSICRKYAFCGKHMVSEESEKSESNSRADETDDSHMPEKSWSNQHYFFRCQKLNVRVPSMLACALPESIEPSLPSRLYLEGKRTQTLPISATLHYTEHSQLSFCPVL